jgi:ketosteroid isomerase-like protein
VTAAADLVRRLSAAFNSRDAERLLTLVTDDAVPLERAGVRLELGRLASGCLMSPGPGGLP